MNHQHWSNKNGTGDSFESPRWYKTILDERRRKVIAGEARFIDWETAKANLRKHIETISAGKLK